MRPDFPSFLLIKIGRENKNKYLTDCKAHAAKRFRFLLWPISIDQS